MNFLPKMSPFPKNGCPQQSCQSYCEWKHVSRWTFIDITHDRCLHKSNFKTKIDKIKINMKQACMLKTDFQNGVTWLRNHTYKLTSLTSKLQLVLDWKTDYSYEYNVADSAQRARQLITPERTKNYVNNFVLRCELWLTAQQWC